MQTSTDSKVWVFKNKWFVIFTFTFGILNGIPFFIMGAKAKVRKWILFGLLYSMPWVLGMTVIANGDQNSILYQVVMVIYLGLCIGSIIHVFIINKEYLLRLKAMENVYSQENARVNNMAKINQYEAEYRQSNSQSYNRTNEAQYRQPDQQIYNTNNQAGYRQPNQQAYNMNNQTGNSQSNQYVNNNFNSQTNAAVPRTQEVPIVEEKPLGLVDINNDSEEEISNLPGIGAILAKRVVNMRVENGSFTSLEDLGQKLGLKPHIVERIRPYVIFSQIKTERIPDKNSAYGRKVDF